MKRLSGLYDETKNKVEDESEIEKLNNQTKKNNHLIDKLKNELIELPKLKETIKSQEIVINKLQNVLKIKIDEISNKMGAVGYNNENIILLQERYRALQQQQVIDQNKFSCEKSDLQLQLNQLEIEVSKITNQINEIK